MNFAIDVLYWNKGYTYDVTTVDWIHFTCVRRPSQHYEDFGAPPEEMHLVKGEKPNPYVWGRQLTALYEDLMDRINDFFRLYGRELPG